MDWRWVKSDREAPGGQRFSFSLSFSVLTLNPFTSSPTRSLSLSPPMPLPSDLHGDLRRLLHRQRHRPLGPVHAPLLPARQGNQAPPPSARRGLFLFNCRGVRSVRRDDDPGHRARGGGLCAEAQVGLDLGRRCEFFFQLFGRDEGTAKK